MTEKMDFGSFKLCDQIPSPDSVDRNFLSAEIKIQEISAVTEQAISVIHENEKGLSAVSDKLDLAPYLYDMEYSENVTGELCVGYLMSNGNIQSGSGSYTTDFIDVSKLTSITVTGQAIWSGRAYAFYDENKTVLSVYPKASGNVSPQVAVWNEEVPIPENAKYIRACWTSNGKPYVKVVGKNARITKAINESIDNKVEALFNHRHNVLVDVEISSYGFINKSNGKVTPVAGSQSYRYSDFVETKKSDVFYVTGYAIQNTTLAAFYDGNQTFMYAKFNTADKSIHAEFRDQEIIIADELIEHPGIKYMRFSTSRTTLTIKKAVISDTLYIYDNAIQESKDYTDTMCGVNPNYLFGKTWYVFGDSFTQGAFPNMSAEWYDSDVNMYKTYPYWIMKRNGMSVILDAVGGATMVQQEEPDGRRCISKIFSEADDDSQLAQDIARSDYLTFSFSQNEHCPDGSPASKIGDSSSTDIVTIWGAWNTVLQKVFAWNPVLKIGIFTYEGGSILTRDTQKAIAKYWGIPYLDLQGDPQVPMLTGGKKGPDYPYSSVAAAARNAAFYISDTNRHPNVLSHQYRSTVIENFMRSL